MRCLNSSPRINTLSVSGCRACDTLLGEKKRWFRRSHYENELLNSVKFINRRPNEKQCDGRRTDFSPPASEISALWKRMSWERDKSMNTKVCFTFSINDMSLETLWVNECRRGRMEAGSERKKIWPLIFVVIFLWNNKFELVCLRVTYDALREGENAFVMSGLWSWRFLVLIAEVFSVTFVVLCPTFADERDARNLFVVVTKQNTQ